VTPGHSLVIMRRHGSNGLTLHQPEWNAAVELVHSMDNNAGLNFKHPIDQVRVTALVDQLQG
jgi:diadenosine tetraphosphate (Ap4A) HIT family hydrolase